MAENNFFHIAFLSPLFQDHAPGKHKRKLKEMEEKSPRVFKNRG